MKGIIALSLVLVATQAEAARYIVTYNNNQTFKRAEVKVAMMNSQAAYASSAGLGTAPAATVQVEHSLPFMNAIVVDAADAKVAQQIADSTGAMTLEEEVFHPRPVPVRGFNLTEEQLNNLSYKTAETDLAPMAELEVGPATPWGILAIKANKAWPSSNAGQGVRVLVLDTGVDRDHPAIKANFEKGSDFIWDNNTPYPYADKNGHGTHVAGTILGSWMPGGFVGVAPKAKLLAGRVCSDEGCSSIGIILGIEWGVREKVDVISMSLGGPIGTAAELSAVQKAVQAGVTVVAASGNDGKKQVSFPAAFAPTIAVGAVDSTMQKAGFSNWGPELDIVAPGVDVKSSVPMGTGLESVMKVEVNGSKTSVNGDVPKGAPVIDREVINQVVLAGYGKPEEFTKDAAGRFVLIQRGEKITFSDKVARAIAAGAAGVIIYNNEPGMIKAVVTTDGSTVSVPVMMIDQAAGQSIAAQVKAGLRVTVSMQTLRSDYAELSGTSMATPHVSGVVALIKAANKSLTPDQVRKVLTQTAIALAPNNENQFGKGMANAQAAVELAIKTR